MQNDDSMLLLRCLKCIHISKEGRKDIINMRERTNEQLIDQPRPICAAGMTFHDQQTSNNEESLDHLCGSCCFCCIERVHRFMCVSVFDKRIPDKIRGKMG